jgi:accessory gene regulator protein AgrB
MPQPAPPIRFGRLEFAFAAAMLLLLFQLAPELWSTTVNTLDFRNWAGRTWRLSAIIVFCLLILKFRTSVPQRALMKRGAVLAAVLLLVVSLVSAVILVAPGGWTSFLVAANPDNWSSYGWVGLFVSVLIFLFLYRYAPEWKSAWTAHSNEIAKQKERQREIEKRREEKKRVSDIIIRGGRIDF